jgi:hypothetical protein
MQSRVQRNASLAAGAALAASLCAPLTARGDWTLASSSALRHDDNVGNSRGEYNQVGDFSATAKLSLFDLLQLGEDYSFAFGGNVGGQLYDQLIGLRNGSLDGDISLKKKWGLGAFAPWIRGSVLAGRANFEDGYRDATYFRVAAEFGERLDARWNLWGEFAFDRRLATPLAAGGTSVLPTDVFSEHDRTLLGNVEYSVSRRVTLTGGALLRHGDVVSTMHPDIYTYQIARAAVADPTFGPNQIAYRFFGTTYGARVGAQLALTAHNLLGVGFQRTETHARGGNDYTDSMPDLIWNCRF